MSDLTKIIGERIREVRKIRGLTQEQLGERAGIHYSYIGGTERGERNISLDTLDRIIHALNLSPADFFQIKNVKITEYQDKKTSEIEKINSLLVKRNFEEVSTIHHLFKNIIKLIDSAKHE
ncbi:helix-turn-helix domain-containing protein [Brevibacillus panacihumi]|uniref:helix-turn-helix domain-containing protein n=1 Tax=Brevibacillus panacihumi TaxID=497735 RepID=UPI003D071F69